MITSAIINLIKFIANGLLSILPDTTGLPSGVSDGLNTIFAYGFLFNEIVPIDTLLQVLGIFIGFEAVIFLWHSANWLFNKFRGSS